MDDTYTVLDFLCDAKNGSLSFMKFLFLDFTRTYVRISRSPHILLDTISFILVKIHATVKLRVLPFLLRSFESDVRKVIELIVPNCEFASRSESCENRVIRQSQNVHDLIS